MKLKDVVGRQLGALRIGVERDKLEVRLIFDLESLEDANNLYESLTSQLDEGRLALLFEFGGLDEEEETVQ